ncbi:uncharacterized protein LOC143018896 [Oratosquilla oratoria]|uniref:uncharacterized protein LOC143018896 n=1 Tax=Oratosquilla oratoria TaxID=337810 RepID=UPI003F766B30
MASLVADYGSSSEDDNSDSEVIDKLAKDGATAQGVNFFPVDDNDEVEEEEEENGENGQVTHRPKEKEHKKKKKEVVDNPLRYETLSSPFENDASSSVFYNPFQLEQQAKKTALEKHVKMTQNPKDVKEINGKRICWNYRKGRCKFGHKCKYAHDSDLIFSGAGSEKDTSAEDLQGNISGLQEEVQDFSHALVVSEEPSNMKKKNNKRPGLSDGLVPSKKAQKMYKAQQGKERPWAVKR